MPKDEILDGSTWTDVQPQKEEILDGSTWTEVKKKDVPAPKLESGSEATISSNGQSKSKSTSASTIVSKPNPNNQTSFTVSKENSFGIPNFQIPGVQKNTFNPLTEQQKAAGKKVLGEGTTVVEQQKVKTETPETSAKKSAILKAVTGKDISYDEVSRLSDVSNTDYAGILAAQKEKQKTDNTFATNPALQEEQRQEQVKQSEFLGNREFKVNNPQANVQILEQKNPTLLKDIADKTLELDEQRTAESFNKDKPVSQRFTKPSSDVPYKPFTDYLEVDELATVSPMELYETREKESDREKQLKYFKDRGNNNIFNEYDNEQTAISYKQGELKKKYNTAVNNLKDKYGENWLYGAEQGDKDLADLISAQKGLQENYNLSRDLLKTDKYAEVNKTIQERAQRQAEIDKTAKDDTWYKFTDESNKIQNVVMNTAYGLVNDIASLPRFFNGLSGNNDFNWTDKVADATQRFTDAGMAYFNTPTDVQRDNVQDYAEVDGYRVFLDKKGNPTSLRDADNFMVNNDAKKEEIFTKYSDNKDKIKVKTDWIDGEQIMNQSSKIIGDMLVMIAEGGGISAGIKGVGKVSRSARILNLAENAKLTTSLAVISQMQNEMMNDAIDKGMSKEDAAKYAAISSTGVAAISLINPMEAQFLKNLKNVKSLASEEVASFVNGGTTLADLTKKTIGNIVGNSVPEIAEEQFFEPVLQNVVNDSYKNQVGVNEQLDQTDVLGRENLAQSVLTATTTFLPSALESSKNMNSNSIKMNILENPENWMAIIDKKKELGIIEDDVYSAEVAAMNKAKKKYDALKSEVKQSDRTKLAGLIGDKVAIESKLSDAPELKPKYENQVKEIDSKISNLTNGISETPETELASAVNIRSQDFGDIESIKENKVADNKEIDDAIANIDKTLPEWQQDVQVKKLEEQRKQQNDFYDSQIKQIENEQTNQNTTEQQDNGNSTGMAGSEQNSKAVRTKSEQGKLSNEDKIQQNATTEVQKQITEVEKIISELEDNPNSPFHKLVNLDEQKQKLSELQKKEAEVKKESAQPVLPETKAQKAANPRLSFLPKKKVQAPAPKIETTPILDEIKSKNLTHVKGKNMGENQALGTFISTEKGNRYETPTQKAEQVEIDIQNPFVVDNGDFGLVDKRQEILNANRDKFDEFDTVDYQKLPAGKLTVDNLNDAGIKKLAELTTNELKSQGYDGIYFRESDTQEGELVVFDKEKVKFKGNNINLVEQSDENGSNKGKSESKGTDTKTESSGTKNTESDTKTQSETTSGNAKRVIRKVKGTPKARRKVRNPEYLKALSHQAESAEDMVLQAFIGGAKISSEIIKKLYTNSGGEVSNRIGLLNKEGFATLSEMAHSLWENQESVFGFEKFDSQEFENAIEGVLNSYSGTKAMVEDLNKRFGSDIDAKQAEEFAKWKEFEANATEEEVSEMADYMESLSEEELNRIYNDKENAFADDYVTLAEGKKPTKRTAGEINADIKIKSAELKLLEDKQSKLNAQLEKNLKENQLDLLQGAKPQSMFDDKVEQQKVAESLKNDIDKKRKEVAKLQDELDNINQGELDLKEPKDLKTDNHQVYYNGKVVDMAYIKNPKEQFKYASQRISDNLGTGGNTEEVGYVKTPEGKIFEVSRKNKSAKLLDGEKLQEAQSKFVPIPLQGKDLIGDALDRMADKIGSKKNLTQKEKTSLIKDVTDLAKGLIQEGKATLDNVIDKIKEAIKKRFPDLDENDLNDISENIKQKVLFDEAFQWYKDNDYTYEEAKKELDDNDVDYNEKDLKAIFAEKKEKSVNEKRLQNRAFDGTTDEELKSIIEDYGLTYETESQIIAEKEANDIIEEVGLERAFQAVQNGYIKGAQAAVVYAKMVDELDTKLADDKITDEERTRLKELQAYSVDIFDTEARDAGRFLAMLNRLYQKSLFTYDTMVKSATKTKGAPLTSEEKLQLKEQSEKIAEFDKKIKELEAKLDEERAQNAVKNIKALNNKPKTASFKAKAKALADKFRQLKSKPLILKDADGNPIELTQNSIVSYNDIIELAAKAIEKTGELLDGINTALQEIKKQKWYQNLSQRDKDAVDRQVKEELLNLDTEVSDDKFKIPNSLLREIVRNGTEDIDGIVEKVLEVYGDIYPDLDARKVRDMITKYGESIESKEDLIGGKLALAKRIGRLLSAKEDLLNGKLPKKSGFQREKPGPTERLLMQEIQQLLKNVPKSQEELDALWATALDKAKNRVKNRIEELQLAIDKAEKINKSKNVQNYNDAGLDNLKSQLKEKQAEYDAAFPKEKSTLSDEQRLNQLINSKKKRLAKLEQQKIDKVYEINKKDGPDKSKFPELAKQIADLDAEIKKVNDEIKADETWKAHVEKKRIELAKKANQRRIDELKRRIDEKDFIVKKNPTPIDDELKQLRREKQKVADDYELAKYKYEQENRSPTQKGIDWILDVLTLPKSLKATLDLSAPLRQGATVLLSNPQIFWNSFIKMHGQAISNNIFEKSIDNIKKSDNYDLAQDSGLQITDPNSIDDRKKDDQFSVKLANKIPLFNKLNKGSERAYSGFLNNIRFNLFEQGVKELENAGIKYEDNPKMFKALASTVNNLTGRGKSADGNVGKFLNFILFSPRMITSRVLILHDLLRTDIPFNSPSRKMAAKSLLGTAVYIGLFNLLGTIASNASGDDDDKDRKPNFNPVATDFLKVRSKQTTFDPTAGYAPLIRTAARIAAEKSINSNGRETDLSKSYGSTRFTPAFDFLENKLSPTISYLANVATHKNPDNKYESASEAEWYDYITGLVAPLQVMQVAQNFNDKDKFGKDLLEVILGLYGIGVQQYDTSSKGKNNSRSSGSSSDGRGTAR